MEHDHLVTSKSTFCPRPTLPLLRFSYLMHATGFSDYSSVIGADPICPPARAMDGRIRCTQVPLTYANFSLPSICHDSNSH